MAKLSKREKKQAKKSRVEQMRKKKPQDFS
jgi:hypothetical protein